MIHKAIFAASGDLKLANGIQDKTMKVFNSVLSIAICVFTFLPEANASAEYDRHYAVGKDFLNREQYKLAIDEFSQALKSSNTAAALVDRGTAYSELKNYQSALADLSAAIKLEPKNTLAYTVRGVVYFRSYKPEAAIADFDKALALNSGDKFAIVNRAGAYLMLKDPAASAKNTQDWLTSTNWKSDFAGHAATLTVLAHKMSHHPQQADELCQLSLKKLNHLFWPYAMLKFFAGKETVEKVMEHAEDSTYDLAQCQTFLGLNAYSRGDMSGARDKLSFVSHHGVVNSVEYWLAKFYLDKIDPPKPAAAASSGDKKPVKSKPATPSPGHK